MSRNWLITGSSRGFGRAIAEAVLESTADRVALTARNPATVLDLVARYPGRAIALALDVTDAQAVHESVGAAIGAFGGLDVVVNNAGYAEIASFEHTSVQSFRDQLEVNFFGVVEVCRAVVPHVRERGAGHIIQISAISGRFGVPGLAADTAAKFAVEGFSETLALEMKPFGVNVTLVEPGGIRTEWAGVSTQLDHAHDHHYDQTVGKIVTLVRENLGREPSSPELCAEAVLRVSQSDDPPLRLVLGAEALEAVTANDQARAASDRHWRAVSEGVDY